MEKITVKNTLDILNTVETTKEYLKVVATISEMFLLYLEDEKIITPSNVAKVLQLTDLEFRTLDNMRLKDIANYNEYSKINKSLLQMLFSGVPFNEDTFKQDVTKLKTVCVNFLAGTQDLTLISNLWDIVLTNTTLIKYYLLTRRNLFFEECFGKFVEQRLDNTVKLDGELRKILLEEEDFALHYALLSIGKMQMPVLVKSRPHTQKLDYGRESSMFDEYDAEYFRNLGLEPHLFLKEDEIKKRSKTEFTSQLEEQRRNTAAFFEEKKQTLLKKTEITDEDLESYKKAKEDRDFLVKLLDEAKQKTEKKEETPSKANQFGQGIWGDMKPKLSEAGKNLFKAIQEKDSAAQAKVIENTMKDLAVALMTNAAGLIGSAALAYIGIPVKPDAIAGMVSGMVNELVFGKKIEQKSDFDKTMECFDKIDKRFDKMHKSIDELQNSLNKNFEHLPKAVELEKKTKKVISLLKKIETTIINANNIAKSVDIFRRQTGNPTISIAALLSFREDIFTQIQEFLTALYGGKEQFNLNTTDYSLTMSAAPEAEKDSLVEQFVQFTLLSANQGTTFAYPFHAACEIILENIKIFNQRLVPAIMNTNRLVKQALYWSHVLPLDAKRKSAENNKVILKKLQEIALHEDNFGSTLYTLSYALPVLCIGENNLDLYGNMCKYYDATEVRFENFNYTRGFALTNFDGKTALKYNQDENHKQLEEAQNPKNGIQPRFLILPASTESQTNKNKHEYRLHCTNAQRDYTPFNAQFLLGLNDSLNIKVRNKATIAAKVKPLNASDFDNDFDKLMMFRKKFDVTALKEIRIFNTLMPHQTLKFSCEKGNNDTKSYKMVLSIEDYKDLLLFETPKMPNAAPATLGFYLLDENNPSQIYINYEIEGEKKSSYTLLSRNSKYPEFYQNVESIGLIAHCSSVWTDLHGTPTADNFYGILPYEGSNILSSSGILLRKCFQKQYCEDDQYLFLLQSDGNLVAYRSETSTLSFDDSYKPRWSSDTCQKDENKAHLRPEMLVMHTNGTLKLYNFSKDEAELSDGDKDFHKKYKLLDKQNQKLALVFTKNGFLKLRNASGNFNKNLFNLDELKSGEILLPDDELVHSEKYHSYWFLQSAGVAYTRLAFQKDGNLVLYYKDKNGNAETPIWATDTKDKGGVICKMQKDGNLVIYGKDDEVVWAINRAIGIEKGHFKVIQGYSMPNVLWNSGGYIQLGDKSIIYSLDKAAFWELSDKRFYS